MFGAGPPAKKKAKKKVFSSDEDTASDQEPQGGLWDSANCDITQRKQDLLQLLKRMTKMDKMQCFLQSSNSAVCLQSGFTLPPVLVETL
jgi:hypothetical protein